MTRARGVAGAPLGRIGILGIVFLVVGAGLAFLGQEIGGPATGLGVAAIGVAAMLAGVHSMRTRVHRSGYESSNLVRDHTGVAAVLFGVAFFVPGVVLVIGGLGSAFGFADGLWGWVEAHAGWAVVGVGIWAGVIGLGMVISKWSYAAAETSWWQRLPGQLAGVWVMAMGVAAVAAGRSLILEPANPGDAAERFGDWIIALLT